MSAGHFTRTYALWRSQAGVDSGGQPFDTWTKQADVSGRAYPASTHDSVTSGLSYATVDWTFACASDTDIRRGDQIRFDGRTLDVKSVPVTSSGQRLECRCSEVE